MKKIVLHLIISAIFLFGMLLYVPGLEANGQTGDIELIFSHRGGFYSYPFTLELRASASDYSNITIYYTIDGSVPSPGSRETNVYREGIYIKDRTNDPNVFSMISYYPPTMGFGGGDWGFPGGDWGFPGGDWGFPGGDWGFPGGDWGFPGGDWGFPGGDWGFPGGDWGYNTGGGFGGFMDFNPDPWREPDGQVFKGTPVRAVAVTSDGKMSAVITNTYFVDSNMRNRYRLPVISIATDKENLFGEQKGLFMGHNVEKSGSDWEIPIHIEFYEADGNPGFAQNAGLRIHGGFTKNFQQKSLRLYANSDYDKQKWFDYEVFPGYKQKGTGEQIKRHKRLILRNSGNDWMNTMIRDGMMQNLVMHMTSEVQAFRQSVVFINGEFWGIYNIRERYDDRYIQSHFPDADRERVVMLDAKVTGEFEIDEGTAADLADYRENVLNYVRYNDMRRKDVYETLKRRIDIESFLDHYTSEIYFANTDWPGSNKVIWKYKTISGSYEPGAPYGLDGRWRFALKDTDHGFAISTPDGTVYGGQVHTDMIYHASTPDEGFMMSARWPDAVVLFSSLLKNEEFRHEFINRLADHLNTAFTPERVNSVIDKLSGNIARAMPEHNARWNYRIKNWEQEVNVLRYFANNRVSYVRQHVINNFRNDVSRTSSITISADSSRGFVRVNSIDINENTPGVSNSSRWSGVYFDGVPISLTAVPERGYRFERWEGVNGVNQNSKTIIFNPQNNMSIRAVFSSSSDPYEPDPDPYEPDPDPYEPDPDPDSGVSADIFISNDWGSGGQAAVTITNNGSTPTNGWSVTIDAPGTVNNLWNGSYTQSGNKITIWNAPYNSVIPAGGQIEVGFIFIK